MVSISEGANHAEEIRTHSYRAPDELGIGWYHGWTHRIRIMKQDNIYPNDVQHGGVPALEHIESHRDSRHLGTYDDE